MVSVLGIMKKKKTDSQRKRKRMELGESMIAKRESSLSIFLMLFLGMTGVTPCAQFFCTSVNLSLCRSHSRITTLSCRFLKFSSHWTWSWQSRRLLIVLMCLMCLMCLLCYFLVLRHVDNSRRCRLLHRSKRLCLEWLP